MPNIITKYGKDGRVSYQAVVRVDKARPVKKTFATAEEAEEWRVAKDAELRELKTQPAYEFTLAEAAEEYSLYYPSFPEELKERLAETYETPIVDIQETELENLSDSELDIIESVIEHSRRHMGVTVPANPVTMLRARRLNLPYRPITQFEEDALIDGAKDKANNSLSDVLILALDTGLVQQEIIDLESNKVYLDQGIIRMNETRVIELTPRAKTVLTRRLGDNTSRVFPDLQKNTVQTAFIRLRTKLGLNGPDFNDLRKIAIHRLSEKLSIPALKEVLGYAKYDSLDWLLNLQKARQQMAAGL
jgi:integrase